MPQPTNQAGTKQEEAKEMDVATQTMSRMASRWPAYLVIALGLAVVALAMLVSPTLAQEAAEATATAAEPVDLAPLGAGLRTKALATEIGLTLTVRELLAGAGRQLPGIVLNALIAAVGTAV